MSNNIAVSNVTIYGITHALVDAACAGLLATYLFSQTATLEYILFLAVIYNVIAFALQAPIGLLIDKLQKPAHAAILGNLLVIVGILFIGNPLLAVILIGLGNAFFHVGGGITSLNLKPKKAMYPGIYVAPGAMGLFVGGIAGKIGIPPWIFIPLLIITGVAIWFVKRPVLQTDTTLKPKLKFFEIAIILLLVSIGIRGIVGLSLVLPWKSNPTLLLILICAIVLGKAFGGILGDRFGWKKVALTGLIVSAPLLAFFNLVPALAIIGAFFFNLTMPITLTALANILPGRAGFAFGLTTLALVIGALPTFTDLKIFFEQSFFIVGIIIVAIVALYLGLKLYFKYFDPEKSEVRL